ncbi:cAMP-responsive element modulator-like isoform X3 [Perca fluviatilis]|uniref:cAMP-responsive element modulator-like isoform X3 n=1 Tax=Perca fluviatilis TaxID=8168 RepID=UPI001962860B|nr:cAMP-responsive element modulator-like isoform X3 [Perca fluviatilis]
MNRRNQSDQQPQSGPVRMNQMKTEETYQPGAYTPCIQRPVPCIQRPVYQQTSLQNQYYGVFQGAPVRPVAETTQNLSMTMTSTQTPQLRSGTLQYYCEENYCMPVGFSQGGPVRFPPGGTQNLPSSAMSCTQTPQLLPRTLKHDKKTLDGPQKNDMPALPGTSGDMTACQLCNTSSSLPQGVANTSMGSAGASAHSDLKPGKGNLQKKELRLMKNREAARECRRKKKEYVKCLENRVALLENQNKTLIEELRALKDIYRHKVE